jgi:hypothetical protein
MAAVDADKARATEAIATRADAMGRIVFPYLVELMIWKFTAFVSRRCGQPR